LSELSFLWLDSNHLTGFVPTTLGSIGSLLSVSLDDNHLEGHLDFLTSLSNCQQLYQLGISLNHFTGRIPDSIGNLSRQLTLFLANKNNLIGEIPASISNLSSLTGIDFSDNQLSNTLP
jgi:Leucine-rich repeat (LRR) protein